MKWFLIAFCTILAYRTVFCISGYARAVYYEKKYNAYLTGREKFSLSMLRLLENYLSKPKFRRRLYRIVSLSGTERS